MGQGQHSQAEKVNRQQEVDVLLGKHLRGSAHKVNRLRGRLLHQGCRDEKGRAKKNLEEEVEAKQSAAGDDGKPGGVTTRDGLGHVRAVLERERDGGRTVTDESEDSPGR